jgi:hypothetical protein
MPITYKVSIRRENYHPSIIPNILNSYSAFLEKKLSNWRRGQFIPEQYGYKFRQRSDLCVHLTFPDSDQMTEFERSIPENVRNNIKFEIINDPISVIYQVNPELEDIFQRRQPRENLFSKLFETLSPIIAWPFRKILEGIKGLYNIVFSGSLTREERNRKEKIILDALIILINIAYIAAFYFALGLLYCGPLILIIFAYCATMIMVIEFGENIAEKISRFFYPNHIQENDDQETPRSPGSPTRAMQQQLSNNNSQTSNVSISIEEKKVTPDIDNLVITQGENVEKHQLFTTEKDNTSSDATVRIRPRSSSWP